MNMTVEEVQKFKVQIETARKYFFDLAKLLANRSSDGKNYSPYIDYFNDLSDNLEVLFSIVSTISIKERNELQKNIDFLIASFDNVQRIPSDLILGWLSDKSLYHNQLLDALKGKIGLLKFKSDIDIERLAQRRENKILQLENEEYLIELTKLRNDLNNQKDQSQKDAEKINEFRNKLEEDIKTFSNRYEPLLEKAEIIANSAKFGDDSQLYLKNSSKWLVAIIIMSIVLFSTLLYLIFCFCTDLTCYNSNSTELAKSCPECVSNYFYFEILGKLILRCFILSLEVYVLSLLVKNYFASKHNNIIFGHRASSLAAAVNLLSYAKSKSERQEILKHAANAIFSHQRTGYLGKDGKISQNALDAILANMKS